MDKNEVLRWLRSKGTQKNVHGLVRYGIITKHAFGVSMATLLAKSKKMEKDHDLAEELWNSGWYEARLLASLIDDPKLVTRAQMNKWASSFENWGDCDTVCFKLFDRSPCAWDVVPEWTASPHEFVKRGGFALIACLALHDKKTLDPPFLAMLPLIERGARDDRNFVKKAVSWALRSIGRRNLALNMASLTVAKRLASSDETPCRWVGKDAARELSSSKVQIRLSRKSRSLG